MPTKVAAVKRNRFGDVEERVDQGQAFVVSAGLVGDVGQAVHHERIVGVLFEDLLAELACLYQSPRLVTGETPAHGEAPV